MKLVKAVFLTSLIVITVALDTKKNLGKGNLTVDKVNKSDSKKEAVMSKENKSTTTVSKSDTSNESSKKIKETQTPKGIPEKKLVSADVLPDRKAIVEKEPFITFNKDTEADVVTSGIATKSKEAPADVKDNPPKPLSPLKDVVIPQEEDPAGPKSREITGLNAYGPPPKKIELLPVSYVKELSPAGKAALELADSGDYEYQKLLNAGFETPKTISTVVDEVPTRVDKAANMDFMWRPMDPRNNGFWKNVEFNKYGNLLLDTHRYFTPARFEKNEFGNVIVHAPSSSDLQITTPARTIIGTQSFLQVSEEELAALDTLNNDDHPDFYEGLSNN